jgi:hypothetical protein
MLHVHRIIVETIMSRKPSFRENEHAFFVGFNEGGRAYLLLPTAIGILAENELYAIPILNDSEKSHLYVLDQIITTIKLNELYEFHDDLTLFFGPEHNMLRRFLDSDKFKSYVNWSSMLREDQIDELLQKYRQADSPEKKETIKKRLTRFVGA